MSLSNQFNAGVNLKHYKFTPAEAAAYAAIMISDPLGKQISQPQRTIQSTTLRNKQAPELLQRIEAALQPAKQEHIEWLAKRGIITPANSVGKLDAQDLLDSFIIPFDHIIAAHGYVPVDGPVFQDRRDGELAGICIRNVSDDLDFVADAKFTFSNYGWFLFGYDDYNHNDEVVICEGVFDALALRKTGYNAIALGSAYPTAFQLAMLRYKFRKLQVCFDNDFWGWYGAYISSKCLNCPILLPTSKDPAEQVFEHGLTHFRQTFSSDLFTKLVNEIPVYNSVAVSGKLIRLLPYNK